MADVLLHGARSNRRRGVSYSTARSSSARTCKAVHRVTQSDRAPIYLPDGTPIAANDQRQFLAAHRDHGLQLLERSSDAEVISHPRWDPMCRVAWEVSDGENELIVTFGRIDIEAPRQYSILPGRMVRRA